MIVAVPVVEAVKLTEHVALPPEPESVQLGGLKLPVTPLLVQLTVPVGVTVLVPTLATVAVQLLDCPVTTVEGEHATLVVVWIVLELTVPFPAPLLALVA